MAQQQQKPAFSLSDGQLIGPQQHIKLQAEVANYPFGQIWRALDVGPGSRTNLGICALNPLLAAESSFLQVVKKHISHYKAVKHQHLLNQQGFFQMKDGLFAIVQEPLDGLSIDRLIKSGDSQKLKNRQLKVLLGQIAIALDFLAKKQQSPHGALCPEFAFINRGSGIKLTGFGMRQALDDVNDNLHTPLSYPHYQAPEAFHPGNISAKSDIYSLASLAYHLLCGELPYMVNAEGERQRNHDKQPRNVSDKQWLTLQRALSDDPNNRPTSAPAFIQALFIEEKEEELKANAEKGGDGEKGTASSRRSAAAKSSSIDPNSRLGKLLVKFPLLEKAVNRPALFISGLLLGFMLGYTTYDLLIAKPAAEKLQQMAAETPPQPADVIDPATGQPLVIDPFNDNSATTEATDETSFSDEVATNPQSKDIEKEDRPSQTVFRDMVGDGLFGPEMVVIPAGKFIKGDDSNFADDNEKPAHEVNIQLAFALSRYEVTFDEYDAFALATGRQQPSDDGWGRGRRPVINVSWHDAQAYTEWLASITGESYRLPTESEWEYAARAGSQTRYSWGDNMEPGYANCDECASQWGGQRTAPVGSFKPNALGLYDMAGNVDEWAADCYENNYTGSPTDGTAARTEGCSARAMRGGSWFDISRLMRPSSRYRNPANGSRNSWGFRVALDLKP